MTNAPTDTQIFAPKDPTSKIRQLFLHISKTAATPGVWQAALDTFGPSDPEFWMGGRVPFYRILMAQAGMRLPVEFWEAMSEHYGRDVFTTPDAEGLDIARAFFLGVQDVPLNDKKVDLRGVLGRATDGAWRADMEASAAFLMRALPRERIWALLNERHQEMKQMDVSSVASIPIEDLDEQNLTPLAVLAHDKFPEAAGVLLNRFPELHQERVGRHNAATLLIGDNRGWEHYLNNGGSLAAPVWRDERTDEESSTPMTALAWLQRRDAIPPKGRTDIELVMGQMAMGAAPGKDDTHFDAASRAAIEGSTKDLSKQIQAKSFERDLHRDARKALSSNRAWRAWRSAEGATVMHFLAAQNPYLFFQRVTARSNTKMVETLDSNGDSIIPYVLIGAATAVKFGNDGRRKVARRRETGYIDVMEPLKDILQKTPKRGVMVSFIEGHAAAFSASMGRARNCGRSPETDGATQILMKYPHWLMAGWTEETTRTLFSSPDRVEQVLWLVAPLVATAFNGGGIPNSSSSNDDGVALRKLLDDQPFHVRLALAVMFVNHASTWRLYSSPQGHSKLSGQERMNVFIQRVTDDVLDGCTPELAKGAMAIINTDLSHSGYRVDRYPVLEAALNRVILENHQSVDDVIFGPEAEINKANKPRKM